MSGLLNDHTHAEIARREFGYEMGFDSGEAHWLAWCRKVEVLGIDFMRNAAGDVSLDGDEDEDGFSLDGASDAFDAGKSPAEYVASARARRMEVAA